MANKTLAEFLALDPTLLDGITLPTGMTVATLKELIMEYSELLCPWIQDAAKLKADITLWSTYRGPDWERILTALTEDYNPIYNYFRKELGSEEIAHHHGTKRSNAYKDTNTPGTTITTTGSVVAYNTGAESETGQSVSTPSGAGDVRQGLAADNYETIEDLSATQYDKDLHSFVDRITEGNIGVTQTVDMIENEIRLRTQQSVYDIIAREFESKFLMQVY